MMARITLRLGVAAIALLVITASASAQNAPAIPKEITILSTEQLKKMVDAKDKFLLVDARNGTEYKEAHIPKAMHVYDKEMDAHKAKFPTDKAYPIVFYCNGYPKCVRSLNGAKTAMSWGYHNVYLYGAGIPEWIEKGYPVERQ